MKIGNIKPLDPREEVAPIPRENGPTLYFTFKSSISSDKARELADKALKKNGSSIIRPGGVVEEITVDQNKRVELIMAINFIKSLNSVYLIEKDENDQPIHVEQPISWEVVDFDDILTYPRYKEELESFGLTGGEISYLTIKATQVNMIDEDMVQKAREDFLASR